jgi:hypothetical protein
MKGRQQFLVAFFILITHLSIAQSPGVAINSNGTLPDAGAILDVQSTTKGLLIPRMTSAQRTAIAFTSLGLTVFDTDTRSFWFFGNFGWTEMTNSVNNFWRLNTFGSTYWFNRDSLPVAISNGGGAVNDAPLNIGREGAITGIENVLTLARSASGIPVPGIGGAIVFRNETNSNGHVTTARIAAVAENVTPATTTGALQFTTYNAGFPIEQLYMNAAGIGMGSTNVDPSALLTMQSFSKGLLIPRMNTAARNGIISPATGLLVFDNSTNSFWYRRPTGWFEVSPWSINTTLGNISNNNLAMPVVVQNSSDVGASEGLLNVTRQGLPATTEDALAIYRTTLGTVANGLGSAIMFRNEGPGNGLSAAGRMSVVTESIATSRHAFHFTPYENGVGTSQLYVSPGGVGIGQTTLGTGVRLDVAGTIRTTGEVNRTTTGAANMVPIAYAVVSAGGALLSSTGNVTVTYEGLGMYSVGVIGQTLSTTTDIVSVTPVGVASARLASVLSGVSSFAIFTRDINGTLVDTQFNIVIYKL